MNCWERLRAITATTQPVTVDVRAKKCYGLADQQPSACGNAGEGSETRQVAMVVECPICGKCLRVFNARHLNVHGLTMEAFLNSFPSWYRDNADYYAEVSERCSKAAKKFWAPGNEDAHAARNQKMRDAWLVKDTAQHAESGRTNALRGWQMLTAEQRLVRNANIKRGTLAATTAEQRQKNAKKAAETLHAGMTDAEHERFIEVRRQWWASLSETDYQRIRKERRERWVENKDRYCQLLRDQWRNMPADLLEERKRICASNAHKSIRKKGLTQPEKTCIKYLRSCGIDVVSQFRVGRYLTDAYIANLNLVVEMYGDFWHCHPSMFENDNDMHPVRRRTISSIYEHDAKKEKAILSKHNLAIIWESDLTSTLIDSVLKYFAAMSTPTGVFFTSMDETYVQADGARDTPRG